MQPTILKIRLFKIVFCFVLIIVMSGCGNQYRYGNQSYRSPEEGLAAQKNDLDSVMSKITPTDKKRGGTAAVVLPTLETYIALGVIKRGNPKPELIDYVGKTLAGSFRGMYDALNLRKIFDKVTLIEDNYPIPMAKKKTEEYDVVVYLDVAGPDQVHWLMMPSV